MALLADKDGFLIGEPTVVDTGRFAKAAALWHDMREDIRAIRGALIDGVRIPKPSPIKKMVERAPVTPDVNRIRSSPVALPQRDAKGRFVAASVLQPEVAALRARRARAAVLPGNDLPAQTAAEPSQEVAVPQRDSRGRFYRKGEAPGEGGIPAGPPRNEPKHEPKDDDGKSGFWGKLRGDIAEAAKSGIVQGTEGVESIDPSIAAAKEAAGLIAPITKPFAAVFRAGFGRNTEKKRQKDAAKIEAAEQLKVNIPWYKKILAKKEPPKPSEAAGGMIGMIAGIAPLLGGLMIGVIPLMLAGVAALVAGGLGAWIGTKIGGWINEKFGMQISDAIWNTSEYIKEKWNAVQAGWDGVTTKISGWADSVASTWNAITDKVSRTYDVVATVPGRVTSIAGDALDATKGIFGAGSKGNRLALERGMTSAGITNENERAMIMAQADHETGGFRSMQESFKYSPDRLRQISSRARGMSTDDLNKVVGGGESSVAEFMYGGRMGNTEAGDAFKYKGRGFVQLTGKENYVAASRAIGVDLVSNPDLAAQPDIAARIATWWMKSKGLSDAAKAGDVKAVTKGINGGYNGLADRTKLFEQYKTTGTTTVSDAQSVPRPVYSTAPISPSIARAPVAGQQLPASTSPIGSVASAAPRTDAYMPGKPPELISRIGSRDKGQAAVQVTVPMPITQNLGDRRIAQVATGGIGGGN